MAEVAEEKIAEKGLPVDEKYDPPAGGHRCHVPNMEEYNAMYQRSIGPDRENFWAEQAQSLRWMRPFRKVVSEDLYTGDVRWFVDGKLNVCDNCVDRWAEVAPDRTAIIYEGDEPTEVKHITFKELLQETCRVANLYKYHGCKKGDRITVYMPMVPEAAYVMLASTRIGAIHSVVFAGFSAASLRDRMVDAQSPMIVTADEGLRGKKAIPLKKVCDEAMEGCDFVQKCFVLKRTGGPVTMKEGRDIWLTEAMAGMRPYCPPEEMDSEDFLFMLYTSGSTGKPKGVAHCTAGYLLWTSLTVRTIFDLHVGDCYCSVADIGWITGHSYIIYGPLANGVSTFMFESVPTYPDPGRYWDMVQRHKITQFYTAPTAIRTLMRSGPDHVKKYDRSSLRVLGSVGEPINPEAWRWFYDVVGDKKCPIMDTFWQTETGGFMMTPMPGSHMMKPGSCTLPMFGVDPRVLDPTSGKVLEGNNVAGVLVFAKSWPSMLRTVYGDHQRMLDTYLRPYPGFYLTGDGCVRDKDGYYWITGRVDDVINVSGHRIGSAEVEHALVGHPSTAEAAVVGYPHEVKGSGLFCYVILKEGIAGDDTLKTELKQAVRKEVGPFAQPDHIIFTSALPKTRSGKIMRRILRKIAENDTSNLGDTSTLLDPSIVDELKEKAATIFK
uniref:Acetyl-coenzyme A synthetase n=1 Tax=Alexandrium andersonii TaxID=327968 RepID=A0A7S2ATL1_9DINO|mmetsp:Transcript_17805/g.40254  ORF Transcript_17805/g.40254 Transcript_17805/m.40254 type:complete len:663 (+) Transcript_17805:79-2067(+)